MCNSIKSQRYGKGEPLQDMSTACIVCFAQLGANDAMLFVSVVSFILISPTLRASVSRGASRRSAIMLTHCTHQYLAAAVRIFHYKREVAGTASLMCNFLYQGGMLQTNLIASRMAIKATADIWRKQFRTSLTKFLTHERTQNVTPQARTSPGKCSTRKKNVVRLSAKGGSASIRVGGQAGWWVSARATHIWQGSAG